MYVCMYAYIYIYIHTCVYIYTYHNAHVYVYIYIYIFSERKPVWQGLRFWEPKGKPLKTKIAKAHGVVCPQPMFPPKRDVAIET